MHRLPLGVDKEQVMKIVNDVVARHPEASVEEINHTAGYWCDPHGPMVGIMQANVERLIGKKPKPIVSLGAHLLHEGVRVRTAAEGGGE